MDTSIQLRLGWLLGFRSAEYVCQIEPPNKDSLCISEGICLVSGPRYGFLSIDDHQKLISAGYTENQVNEIYQDIENYKGNKKYKSLYLTALKWLANNKAKQPEPTKITYLND